MLKVCAVEDCLKFFLLAIISFLTSQDLPQTEILSQTAIKLKTTIKLIVHIFLIYILTHSDVDYYVHILSLLC